MYLIVAILRFISIFFYTNLWHPHKTRFYALTNMEAMRNFEFTCIRNLNCWKLFTENNSFNCQFILLAIFIMRPNSSVRSYGLYDGWIRVRFLARNATSPWPALLPAQPSSLFGTEFLSREIMQPAHEANHSLPSSAEVKNTWRNTSTSPCVFVIWLLINNWYSLYIFPSASFIT
jgi:hypothetical protein